VKQENKWFPIDETPSNPPSYFPSSDVYISQSIFFRELGGDVTTLPTYEQWMKDCWPEFKKSKIEEAKKYGRPEPIFAETDK
jgi:hypothetical protein